MTDEEYKTFKGALPEKHRELKKKKRSKRNLIHENYKPRKHSPEIPDELDWRDYGMELFRISALWCMSNGFSN